MGSDELAQNRVALKPLRGEYGAEQQMIAIDALVSQLTILFAV